MLTYLAEVVSLLDASGIGSDVVFARRLESPDDLEGLFVAGTRLVEVPAATGLHVRFLFGIARAIQSVLSNSEVQVVHLHSSKAGFAGRLVLWLFGRNSGLRVFYTPHGLSFLNKSHPIRSALFCLLEKLASLFPGVAVACSHSEAVLLKRFSFERVVTIENFVSDIYFMERQPAVDSGALSLISVGRLCHQKAPLQFAQIYQMLLSTFPDLRAIWVGDGDPSLKAALEAAGIRVTGWLSENSVRREIAIADIYIQTSLWEGMPLSVLQAMAQGKACVVNDCVGNRDTISHGVTGYIASDQSQFCYFVKKLLIDERLRREMGDAARRESALRFTKPLHLRALRDMYFGEVKLTSRNCQRMMISDGSETCFLDSIKLLAQAAGGLLVLVNCEEPKRIMDMVFEFAPTVRVVALSPKTLIGRNGKILLVVALAAIFKNFDSVNIRSNSARLRRLINYASWLSRVPVISA